jgi:hypothetical protein
VRSLLFSFSAAPNAGVTRSAQASFYTQNQPRPADEVGGAVVIDEPLGPIDKTKLSDYGQIMTLEHIAHIRRFNRLVTQGVGALTDSF